MDTNSTNDAAERLADAHAAHSDERPAVGANIPESPRGTYEPLAQDTAPALTLESAGFLTKAQILAADDVQYEDVLVPEWGGKVRVYGLTAAERSKLESNMLRQQRDGTQKLDASEMRQLFCAYAIKDPATGGRLFSDKEIAHLGKKSAAATDRVYEVASRLSRVSEQDLKELEGESTADR
jgi:hypothetical protein